MRWLLLALVLAGCGTTQIERTEVTDQLVAVIPPPLGWTGTFSNRDSIWHQEAVKPFTNDTSAWWKIDPRQQTFEVHYKPDTLWRHDRDTIQSVQYIERIEEFPFMSKVGLAAAGVVGGVILIALVLLLSKTWKPF
jgi:hypothetical protein